MDLPAAAWFLLAAAGFVLAVFGGRGALAIRAAFSHGELSRLESPPQWPAVRALAGGIAALAVAVASPGGAATWLVALGAGALVYALVPVVLASARRRAELDALDHLPLHLDLVALALEGGATFSGALAISGEHAPPSMLKRAWTSVVLDVHAGVDPGDALRALEERLGIRMWGGLVSALRSAEKFGMALAPVIRDRARQAASNRFARAERRARAVPLKLWATTTLCLAPCTLIVLAFPAARFLATVAG